MIVRNPGRRNVSAHGIGSWQDDAAGATMAAMPPSYLQAIARLGLLDRLRPFDPHVVGTLPLGVAMPGSDIDIVCQAPDAGAFAARLWTCFGAEAGFAMHQWIGAPRPVVARFSGHGWDIEIFGCALPVADQPGWRHFDVERRLLALGGPGFRAAVMEARRQGLKTEPAFCRALGLAGDPHALLFDLQPQPDAALAAHLAAAGYAGP